MCSSAGVRDSALTNHGSLQAQRLGQHFAQAGFRFTRIISSDLQRAYKTANAIRLAQPERDDALVVSQSPLLREQDFGSYEGKPFSARRRSSKSSGSATDRSEQLLNPILKDVESRDSMIERTETFIQEELLPLLHGDSSGKEVVVSIVSHGIILSYLWKEVLKVVPKQSVALAPGLSMGKGGPTLLEHLGGWSNTGYLELDIQQQSFIAANARDELTNEVAMPQTEATNQPSPHSLLPLQMTILTVNGQEHLKSLKRTRGGVGSSRHDDGQKKIEAFFKKQILDS
jgi:broad specificity phosphatase PhoE